MTFGMRLALIRAKIWNFQGCFGIVWLEAGGSQKSYNSREKDSVPKSSDENKCNTIT